MVICVKICPTSLEGGRIFIENLIYKKYMSKGYGTIGSIAILVSAGNIIPLLVLAIV